MVLLKIFDADGNCQNAPLSILYNGEHILGRGFFTNCTDKRISRKHAVIKVDDIKATLTSVHENPCYYISNDSQKLQILSKDEPVTLSGGDKFAFLPQFWYTIQITNEEPNVADLVQGRVVQTSSIIADGYATTTEASASSSQCFQSSSPLKRSLEELNYEGRKKLKTINQSLDKLLENIKEIETQDFPKSNGEIRTQMKSPIEKSETTGIFKKKEISDSDDEDGYLEFLPEITRDTEVITNGIIRTGSECDDEVENSNSVEDTSDDQNEELRSTDALNDITKAPMDENVTDIEPRASCSNNDPSEHQVNEPNAAESSRKEDELQTDNNSGASTNTQMIREQCWYGDSCYRKNSKHREDFSHPGDTDYDEDPNDNRPECSYGGACYRTNKLHRRQYKHPRSRPSEKPTREKRKRKPVSRNEDIFSDTDDSEVDEPFSEDDSSGEEYDVDESDSDFSDSQGVEDNSEVRTMVKEAKKFLEKFKD